MLRLGVGVAVLALAAFGVLYASHERGATSEPALNQRTYSNLDQYLAASADAPAPPPVFVIGIDGASWSFIDPMIEAGELPNFARLKAEGSYGALRSVPCHFSPPAWVSMFSGYLPRTTGVRTFGKWRADDMAFVSVDADDVNVPSIWDIASYGGRRVGVFNVPMTFPVRPLNGAMVSGLMTPIESFTLNDARPTTEQHADDVPVDRSIANFSPDYRQALDNDFNSFQWSLYDTKDDGRRIYDRVSVAIRTRANELPLETYAFDVGRYSPWMRVQGSRADRLEDAWCKMKVVRAPNGDYRLGLSPAFFSIDGPYMYPPELEAELHDAFGFYLPTKFLQSDLVPDMTAESARAAQFFFDYDDWHLFAYAFTQSDNIHHLTGFSDAAKRVYRVIDLYLGYVMDHMPEGGTLLVVSDHGFARFRYGVDINNLLGKMGLLEWNDDGQVDYERSLVFHNLWHVYFNHDLLSADALESRGVAVERGQTPAEALTAHVTTTLADLRTIDGAAPIGLRVDTLERPDGTGPDMFVHGSQGDYFVDFWNVDNPRDDALRELTGNEAWEHHRDGIIAAWGEPIRPGHDIGATDVQNVAPTALYLLDLPIAEHMDGQVMTSMLRERYIAENERYVVGDYAEVDRGHAAGDDKREDLEKKLRSLGYIR